MQRFLLALFGMGLGLMLQAGPVQKFAQQFPAEAFEVPLPVRQEGHGEDWQGSERGPVPGLKIFAKEKSGALWLGSAQGAARFDAKSKHPWDRWQYFSGKRWLADDDVQNIWIQEDQRTRNAWIRTKTGVARIEWRPMTLDEKAQIFDARIENRHNRHGMVADSHLQKPGDLTSNVMASSDNDGLWTAIYLGAQAYRYATTKSPDAKNKARRSVNLLIRLETITGVPGFPARSFVSKSEPLPGDGEWHPTPDGQWLWKGDTSSDELVGHYYGYALYYDWIADAAEKEQIRQVVSRITDYLIHNDYDLIDLDGKPTRWGQWSERYFQTEEGKYEAALRSLELLSFLKTTYHITGQSKYEEAYQDRIRHGYAELMRHYRRWPGGGEINFSDDELAYLSYEPLLRYEKDSKLLKIYREALGFTWSQIMPDKNPLWNYISAAAKAGRMTRSVRDDSRHTLERIPMDLIDWNARNSHRIDVKFQSDKGRFNENQLLEVLAPDERAVSKWNGNPYRPDGGGSGYSEDDGGFFLLPYWMGRYYGWVK